MLLQLPGVTQDSAASGELHVRNEHGNVQYRINGIMLPDGVGAFGQILDTGIVGTLALLTGALPAQYGFRTSGVIDIQTKTDAFNNAGSVSVYGGSHGTITPSFEYGGTAGQTQYFVSGRFTQNNLGIENPTPAREAIHDRTNQEKGFAYVSTVLDPTSRLTYIGGVSNATFQIPNNPGQTPNNTAFGVSSFNSASLNEHQNEFNQFNVVAYQKSVEGFDTQIAYFNRYSQCISILTRSAISSSTACRRMSTGGASSTASRRIRPGASRGAYAAVRLHGERRAFAGQQCLDPAAARRSHRSTAGTSTRLLDLRQERQTGWLVGTYCRTNGRSPIS